MLPEVEKREIKNTVNRYIEEFRQLRSADEKEVKFKEILDYLLTKPFFISSYNKFKRSVLQTINRNRNMRGFVTPIIDYNYYYNIIETL